MVSATEVLIVGAGPAGLTLAVDLARRGVRTRIVEQADRLFPGSRGKGLQPRTQEVFDDLGVMEAVRRGGGPYPRMVTWQAGERGQEWDMQERQPPTPFGPYGEVWMLPQWRTQEILHARLEQLGGRVEFGSRVIDVTQDSTGVTAHLSSRGEGHSFIRARYAVAADGGRSTVRRILGIRMTGESVDPHPMLVADVRVAALDRRNWHVWPQEGGGGVVTLCPLPGTDRFQLVARYADHHATPDTSPDGVRKVVATGTHLTEQQVTDVSWASDFRPRAALAERFRHGGVFLVGDAAHVHSPAGGQGLNTSVQDAYNLGWKLGEVTRHHADPALLDTYEAERLPVAAEMLGLSTRLHTARGDHPGAVMARRGSEARQLGIGYRFGPLAIERRGDLPSEALRAGDRAPDSPCTTVDGTPLRLFDAFRGPHATLLAVGDLELPTVSHPRVRSYRVDGPAVREAYGSGIFLVRPDGYIGLATDDPVQIAQDLPRFVGPAD